MLGVRQSAEVAFEEYALCQCNFKVHGYTCLSADMGSSLRGFAAKHTLLRFEVMVFGVAVGD